MIAGGIAAEDIRRGIIDSNWQGMRATAEVRPRQREIFQFIVTPSLLFFSFHGSSTALKASERLLRSLSLFSYQLRRRF